MYNLIKNKQLKLAHNKAEIESIVNDYTKGAIPDYQMSAWLMAVYLNGMNTQEVKYYTEALVNSGEKIIFKNSEAPIIDKHSTGGVGDKISLILGPILAACGCHVPMIVGRGLGHTGGTLDKLESIPNYNAFLNTKQFKNIVKKNGISIIGQTKQICPADRKIYALRDLTGTIESMPLICGSILSKKIAEGAKSLVLDIKIGNGAFMKNKKDALELGKYLKKIGVKFNLNVNYVITDMNQPLGQYSGLKCEVFESMEILKGNSSKDIMKIIQYLGKTCLEMVGIKNQKEKIKQAISDGSAYEKFLKMVYYHGGKIEKINFNPQIKKVITAKKEGYLNYFNTKGLGMTVINLGGGRNKIEDSVDSQAGFKLFKKHGELIQKNEPIAEIFCSQEDKIDLGEKSFNKSIKIVDEMPKKYKLIY
tara:strand:+ start:13 stop:1272 length:1260 start_codon:yes stop_codon:yes gene_type:complete